MTSTPRALLLLLVLIVAVGAGAPSADAAGHDRVEESSKTFTTSIQLGSFWLNDANIQSIYGDNGKLLTRLSFGLVPWSRYLHIETTFSFGFLQFLGDQQFVDSGQASADGIWMTIFPLHLDLLVGVDLIDEQPVVPYGGIGFAWTLWREHEKGGGDEWTGDRLGLNAFFGLAVLLDGFERARSRRLDADSGINDVFFTIEARWADVRTQFRNGVATTEGLGFGGWSFQGGLKLVY